MQAQFDAVILAGRDPNRPDPLAADQMVSHKVLIDIAGHPMIWHVVQALAGCPQIGRIVIVGLAPTSGVDFGRQVDYLADQGSLLDNVIHGFGWLAEHESPQRYALLLTGDAPLLTGAMIDWFINACHPLQKDVYWGIVARHTMEATFPASRRSYLRLVEGQFCSGDLFLGKIEAALRQQVLIRQLVAQRKHVLRQLWLLGPITVAKFFLRRLRLSELLSVVERLLGLSGGAVILPFAEAGMDVDKPHQLAQVRDYAARHIPSNPLAP